MVKITRRQFFKATGGLGAGLLLTRVPGKPPVALAKGSFAPKQPPMPRMTSADRKAAAARARALREAAGVRGPVVALAMNPGGVPDYFGTTPNFANSPLPVADTPTVAITGGLGSGATATATVNASGVVTGVTVTNAGSGYTSAPTVTITGSGTGATATAVLDASTGVKSITVTNGGAGYLKRNTNGTLAGAMRKFVDALPGLGAAKKNKLGQYIPIAVADTTTYPGSDYYEIELRQYTEQMHSDLLPTTLRGYVQVNMGTNPATQQNTVAPDPIHYLGPLIIASKDRPVRIKFTNRLGIGAGGDLFLPTDTTLMGAGMGPLGMNVPAGQQMNYTQNRATLHLHGGRTPWISDGTPHQWTTPAQENTPYPKGVSVQYVPDMWYDPVTHVTVPAGTANATNDPGPGSLTFYYTNAQTARLMFYHDHAYGLTRLNVYAGEAAGYLITDAAEQSLVSGGAIPAEQIPLIIQDKTFLSSVDQLMAEDPTWPIKLDATRSNLWFPHVYMPNQNPYDIEGANAMGRWDYGPWFWPPYTGLQYGPVTNPYYDPVKAPWEPPKIPGTPNVSIVPEGFMDTAVVNGTAYPYLEVEPKAYRFRILNACNDRSLNLQLYLAASNQPMWDATTGALLDPNAGEVPMVQAVPNAGLPSRWPTDGRDGGVPDPKAVGPSFIQIGTEGGLLPQVAVLENTPVGYDYNRRSITVLNVTNTTLFMGPAERADVVVDFSAFAGKTIILYNDAPAPVPAFDTRFDYYTGNPDEMDTGGTPTTQPGYGPNTRTIMQLRVAALPGGGVVLNGVNLTTGGGGYTAPVVTFSGGGGSGAAAAATGKVDAVKLAANGAGYGAPAVTFSGGGGSGAAATATGAVDGVSLTAGGAGYRAPTVALSGGGGSGATATATGVVDAVVVPAGAGGSGYSAPAVTLNGGGGSGATAVASGSVDAITVTPGAAGTGYTTPLVSIAGGGGSGATATATVDGTGAITAISVVTRGSGYTSAPVVSISDSTGTGAAATATLTVTKVDVLNAGSGFTAAPTVTIADAPGGAGSGATATATVRLTGITLGAAGTGYTAAPTVTITDVAGGTGAGATAQATISVTGISVSNGGSGYASAPTVIVADTANPATPGLAATATLVVTAVSLTNPGSGYTSAPTVTIADSPGGTGSGASATATLGAAAAFDLAKLQAALPPAYAMLQPEPIVPQIAYSPAFGKTYPQDGFARIQDTSMTFWNGPITGISLTNGGSGYTAAPTVTITGGGGSGAAATAAISGAVVNGIALTKSGSGYTSAPAITLTGGGGTGATATATITRVVLSIAVTRGGSGYTSAPTVTISGGGGKGATATATVANGAVTTVTVTNAGSGYTSLPTVGFSGGGGRGATAAATLTGIVNSLTVTNGGSGYASAPTVGFSGGGGTGAAASATILPGTVSAVTLTSGGTGYTSAPTVTLTGGGGTGATAAALPITLDMQPKAIQELFTTDYGRMNATLGVELPNTSATTQTTIPYGFADPPTEIVTFLNGAADIGLAGDSTQIWKITHNGVDTHAIHFHLFDVQLINRVGWDGMVKPPAPNEVGWKDTVHMNPLEDCIVALRPTRPPVPWELPNSVRPLDPTMPLGTTGFTNVDPANQPATVNNEMVNFGWEYVWHCHLLGHEENDMMRPVLGAVQPTAPSNLTAALVSKGVSLTWTDNAITETGFTVQRATASTGPWQNLPAKIPASAGKGKAVTYTDTSAAKRTTYFYRVVANNVLGYTQAYAAPAIGYPNLSIDSAPSNVVSINTSTGVVTNVFIMANGFEAGLAGWTGAVGNVQVVAQAAMGVNGGQLGMAAVIGRAAAQAAGGAAAAQAAYVYDTTPSGEVSYDASFYFHPNGTQTGSEEMQIFAGLDQQNERIFAVEYESGGSDSGWGRIRGWILNAGEQAYTNWSDITNAPHKIEVAWESGASAGMTLFVDDRICGSVSGNTSAARLYEVLLGPSSGLPGASGTMYFDDFASNRLNGVQHVVYLPGLFRK